MTLELLFAVIYSKELVPDNLYSRHNRDILFERSYTFFFLQSAHKRQAFKPLAQNPLKRTLTCKPTFAADCKSGPERLEP